MNRLTETIRESLPVDTFSSTDVANLLNKSDDARYGLIKRAVADEDIINIRRGLYCLAPRWQRRVLNNYALAQKIYGPSYISLESALSYHGLIPEAVYTITSVSEKKSNEFRTHVGNFSYSHISLQVFYNCVSRIKEGDNEAFFMAKPLKALTDYVYVNRKDWVDLEPVLKSLRIDEEDLAVLDWDDLEKLLSEYKSSRVEKFIKGIINEY